MSGPRRGLQSERFDRGLIGTCRAVYSTVSEAIRRFAPTPCTYLSEIGDLHLDKFRLYGALNVLLYNRFLCHQSTLDVIRRHSNQRLYLLENVFRELRSQTTEASSSRWVSFSKSHASVRKKMFQFSWV